MSAGRSPRRRARARSEEGKLSLAFSPLREEPRRGGAKVSLSLRTNRRAGHGGKATEGFPLDCLTRSRFAKPPVPLIRPSGDDSVLAPQPGIGDTQDRDGDPEDQ